MKSLDRLGHEGGGEEVEPAQAVRLADVVGLSRDSSMRL